MSDSVNIGLLGLGIVGSGVAKALMEKSHQFKNVSGKELLVKKVLIRDSEKQRMYKLQDGLLTTNPEDIIDNPDIDIIVEVMGGLRPANEYIKRSILAGKHVITANKELIANHGPELLSLAQKQKVHLMFEASVAGGTPIIAPLLRDLAANEILAIHGIINGTTNYILSKMAEEETSFDEALAEAQELGYAESDPSSDVSGDDAAFKLAILSSLAFHTAVRPEDVFREGITRLAPQDFRYAKELGYQIKLLAIATRSGNTIQARVHPALVPTEVMIAKVEGVLNAIEIQTDLAGRVLFHGRGAGSEPTASAIIADMLDISKNLPETSSLSQSINWKYLADLIPIDELETKYYIRLNVREEPGVFAQILQVLGEEQISIASAIQKAANFEANTAEIVLMTHRAKEASIQQALTKIEVLDVVDLIGNLVRVEEWN